MIDPPQAVPFRGSKDTLNESNHRDDKLFFELFLSSKKTSMYPFKVVQVSGSGGGLYSNPKSIFRLVLLTKSSQSSLCLFLGCEAKPDIYEDKRQVLLDSTE